MPTLLAAAVFTGNIVGFLDLPQYFSEHKANQGQEANSDGGFQSVHNARKRLMKDGLLQGRKVPGKGWETWLARNTLRKMLRGYRATN